MKPKEIGQLHLVPTWRIVSDDQPAGAIADIRFGAETARKRTTKRPTLFFSLASSQSPHTFKDCMFPQRILIELYRS